MTAPDLAALSAAATPGKWYADCDQVWEVNGPQICDTVAPNLCENAAFIVSLVNEYRAGRLVQIDEGMRERVEPHVMVCPQCEGEGGYPDGVDEDACHTDCPRCGGNGWIVDADAAIAAMMGDKP